MGLLSIFHEVPPPPPLPKYDPQIEASKYDFESYWYGPKPEEPQVPWTKVGEQPASKDLPDWRGVVANKVIKLKAEPYNIDPHQPDHYFWFDTPDYADPFKKLWWSAKFFGRSSLMMVTLAGLFTKHKTLRSVLKFYGSYFPPLFLGGMTGSVSVVTVANLRKTDDWWNYATGGFLGGIYIGKFNFYSAFFLGIAGTIFAIAVKHNAETNGSLIPMIPQGVMAGRNLQGLSGKNGITSGDFSFGLKADHYGVDPGREQRVVY